MKTFGYLSPSAVADQTTGRSHAAGIIRAGETVAVASGSVLARADLDSLPDGDQRQAMQIDDALFVLSDQPTSSLAHRCSPNCGLRGGTIVVALRDIMPGEELTIDQAMCDGSDVDDFECTCGASTCRGKITGNDWMIPELQIAYRGSFSPYLAARIASLVNADAGRRAFSY